MFVITDSFQLERLALVVPFLKQSSMYNTFEVSKHLTVSLFEDFSHEIVIMLLLRNTTLNYYRKTVKDLGKGGLILVPPFRQ